jgi:hypothetical protein
MYYKVLKRGVNKILNYFVVIPKTGMLKNELLLYCRGAGEGAGENTFYFSTPII